MNFDRIAKQIIDSLQWPATDSGFDRRISEAEQQLAEARAARAEYHAWRAEQYALLEHLGYAHRDETTGELIIRTPTQAPA